MARNGAPSPSPTSTTPAQQLQHVADQSTGWLDQHWQNMVGGAVQIVIILVIAVALRAVVRKLITQLTTRMGSDAPRGRPGVGLLVSAERRRQRASAIGSVLRSVSTVVILGTAVLMILSVLQIDLAPLLASAGVAGVAVGFGARNLVTDFISGVFMILEDQFGVGDWIDAGTASGTVLEVGLRVTKLRADDGAVWYVRNGTVNRIGNRSQGWTTAEVEVQVGYFEDAAKVRRVLTAAAEEMAKAEPWDEALWEPVSILGVSEVSENAMTFQLSAKTQPGRESAVARELRERAKAALDEARVPVVTGGDTLPEPAAAPDDAS